MRQASNKKNLFFILCGVVVNAATLFIVYKFTLSLFGAELSSIWALVMSVSGAAKLADFGLATIMPKFITEALESENSASTATILCTATYSVFLLGVAIALILYFIFIVFGELLFNPAQFLISQNLILYALPSFVITAVANSILYSLDAWGDAHLRGKILIVGVVLYAILCIALSSVLGLVGLVIAHLLQGGFILFTAFYLVRKRVKENFLHFKFISLKCFKDMFKVSINIQAISLLSIFGENLVKVLIGYYSDVKFVVYYEMASKLISQIRMLAISGCQLLVPIITKMKVDKKDSCSIVDSTINALFPLTIVVFSGVLVLSPLLSYAWIGEVNTHFLLSLLIVSSAMLFNIPLSPVYFSNVAGNRIKNNLIAQFIISISNFLIGLVLGYLYGFYGVVISYTISIAIGSLYLYYKYASENEICIKDLNVKNKIIYFIYFIPIFIFYRSLGEDISFFSLVPVVVFFVIFSVNLIYFIKVIKSNGFKFSL